MARFTETQKQTLRDTVLDKTFSGREESLATMRQMLAEQAYASQGAHMVDLLKGLPKGVARLSADMRCYFGGQTANLPLATERPHGYRAWEQRLRFGTDDPLTKRFEEINLLQDAVDKDRKLLRSQINSLLSTITTDKQLLAVWPEVEEFVPKGEIKNLPVPLTEDLNKMIQEFSGGAK